MANEKEKVEELTNAITTKALLTRTLTEWRPVLATECQVYVFGENFVAKRFDQINYKFCNEDDAKSILIDNLYALLRFKYFPKQDEDIDSRITKIVKDFTVNLKTSLKKVSYDTDTDCEHIKMLPDGCLAFRNGVFNFKTNDWLFKYDIISIKNLSNKIYMYDPSYTILWYLNYDFDPLPININETSLEEFIEFSKECDLDSKNYCFELMYNISHDVNNKFSFGRFEHLCEIMGYQLYQSFVQAFVMLIGAGGNGKNSLFDGCFTSKVVPIPSQLSLNDLEEDDFATGTLAGKSHNIFLEADPKTHTSCKMLKELTGSMFQTINIKNVPKYTSIINARYMFSANDQEQTKFNDNTPGFRRRANFFEIWYEWDEDKRYLTKGDYYETTFSESLHEIKSDIFNYIFFVYFGMYGILAATKNWSRGFKFTYNDWKLKYSDVDMELKDKIESISPETIAIQLRKYGEKNDEWRAAMFDADTRQRMYKTSNMTSLGYEKSVKGLIELLSNPEEASGYFAEYDFYLSVKKLQEMVGEMGTSPITFTQKIKKLYNIKGELPSLYNNKSYVRCSFYNNKLKVLNKL